MTTAELLQDKFKRNAAIKENELELKKMELELQQRKLVLEEEEQKMRLELGGEKMKLEAEERKAMIEHLKTTYILVNTLYIAYKYYICMNLIDYYMLN